MYMYGIAEQRLEVFISWLSQNQYSISALFLMQHVYQIKYPVCCIVCHWLLSSFRGQYVVWHTSTDSIQYTYMLCITHSTLQQYLLSCLQTMVRLTLLLKPLCQVSCTYRRPVYLMPSIAIFGMSNSTCMLYCLQNTQYSAVFCRLLHTGSLYCVSIQCGSCWSQ